MKLRRHLLVLIGVVTALAPTSAWTQQPGRLQNVDILSPGKQLDTDCVSRTNQGPGPGCFLEALRAFGYGDGRNVTIPSSLLLRADEVIQ